MSHEIHGERFFGWRTPAWHKLGIVLDTPMSATEALATALKGGHTYDKRSTYVMLDGQLVATDGFAIVRSAVADDPHERVFGYVTDRYDILQPLEIAEMFDEHVNQPIETMGMLEQGRKLFVTWNLTSFDVGDGNPVNCYGFISCGYDGLIGTNLYTVYQRVVCRNTWRAAVSEAESSKSGMGRVYSGRHISPNMRRDLSLWMAHVQSKAQFDVSLRLEQAKKLASEKLAYADAKHLLEKIYASPKGVNPDQPAVIKAEKETAFSKAQREAERDRDLVLQLFSGQGTAIDATAWGLFNACTEYENWGRMTKKPAEVSIMLGNRAEQNNHAWNVLTQQFS